jgi:arginyl-tRNA synthetase
MFQQIKQQLATSITQALEMLGVAVPVTEKEFIAPPKPELGDLSFPCFTLSKSLGKNPAEIARELAHTLQLPQGIASVEPAGPYLNFRLAKGEFTIETISTVLKEKSLFGTQPKKHTKIMIEYGSPNTHKEVHVGHLRNFALGLSVVKLAEAAGYDVHKVNYLGDIGAHVAKWMWYFLKNKEDLAPKLTGKSITFGHIYTEASKLADELPSAKDEIAETQRKLEARDSELHQLWLETRDECLNQLDIIFKQLGCEFEKTYLESQVEEQGKILARHLVEKGIAKEGDKGALIVDLESEKLGIFLVLKSDGSALYSTKELALAGRKFADFPGITKSIHVVDNRQSLYFKQLFKTLERMGFHEKMEHLAYDFVTLQEGAMSSRKGNIITYEDFRDEMLDRVTQEIRTRHTGHSEYPDWSDEKIQDTAWIIAEAAMKFGMLKQDINTPIVFNMDDAISFDGFTGPYIQYAHARLTSIIAKAGGVPTPTKTQNITSLSDNETEFALAKKIAEFPEHITQAANASAPNIIARYAFELAQTINDFYRDTPVLNAEPEDKARRLQLAEAARITIQNALALLGIKAPQEM